uniref:Uncharacterized protein n=1 Tax=Arundo donax TaxID=35708 RepID=A0A0A8ZUT6_ARUDO
MTECTSGTISDRILSAPQVPSVGSQCK